MKRKLVGSVCLVVLTFCALPAMAGPLYSNLGSGTSVYNCCSGWTVSGSGYLGSSFIAANEFQVTASGSVTEIDIAVSYVTGDNSFYVAVDADNAGQPGTQLAVFSNLSSNTTYGDCCGLVIITGIYGLNLTTATNYWMVVGPTDTTATTWGAWNFSNSATGIDEYSTDGGETWNNNGEQPQGAFQILSGCCGTPEPTSLLLFGSALVAALGAIRRQTKF